jgi:FkbM family methyltransferase
MGGRYNERDAEETIAAALKNHPDCTLLDVGSNVGQFGLNMREAGFTGPIISFEPTSAAHARLKQNAAHDANWTVAPRCAVGAKRGTTTINISENSVSSSVLPMLNRHAESAPQSKYVSAEVVDVITLDSCDLIPKDQPVYIKIDTQGFELEVLKGAKSILARAHGVLTEVSLTPLYEGAPDYRAVCDLMAGHGFSVWAIKRGYIDRKTGQQLQADFMFFRDKPAANP